MDPLTGQICYNNNTFNIQLSDKLVFVAGLFFYLYKGDVVKKLLLGLLFCFCSLPLLAAKGQVSLVGPVGVQINAGWSQWSAKLNPIKVNPIQVMFWSNHGQCRVIPVTNVSVKYSGDDYWYTATFKDRYFYVEEQKMVEGVKLDFYLEGPSEACVISVYGYREIGGGI